MMLLSSKMKKITNHTKLRICKANEDMIKMNTSYMRLFSSTKDCTCNNRVKIVAITIGDPSFTLTSTTSFVIKPESPIIHEMYNLKEGTAFNDIVTLVNEHIILY